MPTLLDELLVLTKIDLTGLGKGLQEAEAQAARTRATLTEALNVPTNPRFAQQEAEQAKAIAATTTALERKVAIMRAESAAISQGIASGQSYKQMQESIAMATKEADLASRGLGTASGALAREFAASQALMRASREELKQHVAWHENLSKTLVSTGAAMRNVGTSLTLGVTAPFALVSAAAAHAALGFDQIMTRVVTLAGVTPQVANQWREMVLTMAPQVGRKPDELAEGLYRIASSGLDDKNQAPHVLEAVAKGAAVGLGDVATVAETVTSAMNAYSASGLSAAKATGILVEAVTQGKGEAKDFAPILGRVGAMASELGISFGQVAGGIAAMTRLGLNADEAATAIRRMFVDLAMPKGQQADLLQELHLSAEQLRKTLRGPEGVLDALVLIRNATGGSPDLTRRLFPDIRGMIGAMSLSGTHLDSARQAFGAVTGASEVNLERAFAFTSQSPSFKMEQVQSELQTALTRFGKEVLPTLLQQIEGLSTGVGHLAKEFSALPEPVKHATLTILELAAAGPMLWLSSTVVTFAGNIGKMTLALGALGAWMAVNPWFLGLAAAGAVAVVAKGMIDETIDKVAGPEQKGSPGQLVGAFAGILPPELSNFRAGSSFSLRSGIGYAIPEMGQGPHILSPAEKAAAERLAKERENAKVEADRAEESLFKRMAGITGDTSGLDKKARQDLADEEARAMRRAAGDEASLAQIRRRFAAERIALGLEEQDRFLQAEQKKEQAVDRSTEHAIRAVQLQEHAEVALLDVQLSAARRMILADERRGVPLSKILVDLQQEIDLIQKKATTEIKAARDMEPFVTNQLQAAQARISDLRKRKDDLGQGGGSGLSEETRKAEAYQIDQQIYEVEGKILELQAKKNDLTDQQNHALEKSRDDLQRIKEEQDRLTASPTELLRRKLGREDEQQNEKWADIMLSGIHDVSRAMSDMIMKGKAD